MNIKTTMTIVWLGIASLAATAPACAAAKAKAHTFKPRQTFAPFHFADSVNRYRSASGVPGPDYWQNQADYAIHAKLNPKNKTLSAKEVITYTNHSPNALHFLWLQLDQNRYRKNARANFSDGKMPAFNQHTRGYRLARVRIQAHGRTYNAKYLVSDTRMRIALKKPLAAQGGSLKIKIKYHYKVPGAFGGRTQWAHTKNGDIFDIAQWYPRLCVYDDIRGWDTAPFLNQEFYLEYGDYDYHITVPADMIVVGSGQLQNPKQVLTARQRRQLAKARHSEQTVTIRSVAEANSGTNRGPGQGWRTWHFHMNHTRDVSFAASKAYVWDAARIDLPDGQKALAMSVYPVKAAGNKRWGRATEYLKHTVENFSKRWGMAYPYPVAIAAGGPVGGMEYPGLVFDSWKDKGKSLFSLTAHEIGHTWFPMIVGSDERRHAWMDEGMNTFIDVYAAKDFNHGEYAPKRDSEFAPAGGNPVEDILKVLDDPNAPPIMTRADLIPEKYRHPVTYFKAALGLKLLREQILGPKRFDTAFKRYIKAWAYKHPQPSDFFRMMDSAAGEDLSWFWRGWFAHNWRLDMAVTDIKPIDGDYSHGAKVTVANYGRLVMPATLRVTYADGHTHDVRVPVATWMQHHQFTIKVAGDQPVVAAEIDPKHVIPDDDRSNNTFKTK